MKKVHAGKRAGQRARAKARLSDMDLVLLQIPKRHRRKCKESLDAAIADLLENSSVYDKTV